MMGITIQVWFLLMIIVDISTSVKDVPMINMEALIGETVYLPCNISTQEINDDVILILWYREDKGTPIYSVDVRDRDTKSAKRWSDETVFANRAYFIFEKLPGELAVQSVRESDTGIYRCRVDFKVAQTRNIKVNLTIIVPPERISIKDESNTERTSVVGPYSEGDIIKLKCDVYGGKPTPTISWYRDGIPLGAETNFLPNERHLRSSITLGPLTRQDLNSRLTCKSVNHQKSTPIETTVQLDMNFAPLNIRLLGAHQPLSAGRRYDLLCQSSGSRPPAMITWYRDNVRLDSTTETTSSDGNQTTSTLSITLSRADAGKYLSCRAHNHAVPSEALEDGWRLDIQYVPETRVRLGTPLDPEAVREGTDLYFDCIVSAHPPVYKVEWRHNGEMLPQNVSKGVIISNHSLVLQGVSRTTAGNYSCVGFNSEGDGTSPPFELNVMYAPTCAPNQPRIYGVAKQENAQIKCVVDANPPEVEFKWTFNNSAESIDVAASHVARFGTSSIVSYTPMTELDYGTLLCMATNKIGKQKQPCVFHIIAAGRPDQVHNCTVSNISMTSLGIKCTEGFNGGLTQTFLVEVRDMHTQEMRANITSPIPRFTLANLQPGGLYSAHVYAYNPKGRSDPAVLQAAMLRLPEKRLENERPKPSLHPFGPMVTLTIGLAMVLVIGTCAIVLIVRCACGGGAGRNGNNNKRKEFVRAHGGTTVRTASPGPSDKSATSKEIDGNESDEKNPDVIPDTIESDEQIDYIRRRQHISTIDTNSPSRVILASNNSSNQSFVPVPSGGMSFSNPMGGAGHTPYGYCTLRNGGLPSQSIATTVSMSPVPNSYPATHNTSTLPRHPVSGANHVGGGWPSYGGAIAGVRNINVNGSNHIVPPPPSTIAMQHLGPTNGRPPPRMYPQQQQQQQQTCLVEDDHATVETPLMIKRESTV